MTVSLLVLDMATEILKIRYIILLIALGFLCVLNPVTMSTSCTIETEANVQGTRSGIELTDCEEGRDTLLGPECEAVETHDQPVRRLARTM